MLGMYAKERDQLTDITQGHVINNHNHASKRIMAERTTNGLITHKRSLEQVRESLGQPRYEFESALSYCGDCLKLLRKLPTGVIDLTITSPPYNIGKSYETVRPIDEYVSWCSEWMAEIYRVTSPTGAFWLNLGYISMPGRAHMLPLSYLLWDKSPFTMVQEVVWNYGAGVAGRRVLSPRNEKFLWYVKDITNYSFNLDEIRDPNVKYPNQKKNGKIRVNPIGKNPSDVWQIPKVTTGQGLTGRRASPERTSHPAQFPIAVIDRIVKASSNPGDLVLDPFLGSGTTMEAALRNGRSALGFELCDGYLDIAYRRVKTHLTKASQGELLKLLEDV